MTSATEITIDEAEALVRPLINRWLERGPKPALNIRTDYGLGITGARVCGVDHDGITISDHYCGALEVYPWDRIDSLTVCGGCKEVVYLLVGDEPPAAETKVLAA